MREGLGTRLESSHIPTPGNKAIKSTDASGLSIFRDSYYEEPTQDSVIELHR